MKTTITIFAITILLSVFSFSQVIEITTDSITGYTIWEADTVKIYNDLTIDIATTLLIQPGTVIEFQGHFGIEVHGNILALGTPEDTILFTVKDTLGFHNLEIGAGGWNGIKIDNSRWLMWMSDSSKFHFCKFEFSKSIESGDEGGGGAFLIRDFPKVLFTNCLFENNASRTTGGAIQMGGHLAPGMFFCSFKDNYAMVYGGAIEIGWKSSPLIYMNLFYNNKAESGGAIFTVHGDANILNCTFSNNSADLEGGAIMLNNSTGKIIGNQINNNYARGSGGGTRIENSWPEFHNNTVCYNHAGNGGGMIFWGLCNADFFNNIIWGNTRGEGPKEPDQISIASTTSTPNFFHCLIQNGLENVPGYTGQSGNIIQDNPLFIMKPVQTGLEGDGLEVDLSVEIGSPVINRGSNNIKDRLMIEHDRQGKPRILHGILDIGAFETQVGSFETSDTIKEYTKWIADTVRVTGDIIILDSATLDIAPGTLVEFQGHYKVDVMGTLLSAGTLEAPIIFTIDDTSGFAEPLAEPGSWEGIRFDNSQFGANAAMNDNDTSRIKNCIIQFAKNIRMSYEESFGGGILVRYFSRLEISGCTIQYNMAGNGGGIGVDMFSHPYIHDNVIYRNLARNFGGGLQINNRSNPRIVNNYIVNNSVIMQEGGITWGGGLTVQLSDPVIINNVICNNYAALGGGIFISDSKPVFSNNTVCNNEAWDLGGGLFLEKSAPNIVNSIFRGNSAPNDDQNKNQGHVAENVNFYHNNIEGGRTGIIPLWFQYQGDYSGNIDDDPSFVNPTEGPGTGFDALAADWSLTDYSPNINRGFPESGQLGIPDKDITGKRRYNHEIIDIGAFENQGEPIHLMGEPYNQFACVGDTVEFSVEIEGNALFQWLKDGEEIPGADTNVLRIDSVNLDDKADYICVLYNGYGLKLSNNVTLDVNAPPEILLQTESQWVKEDATLKLEIHGRGTEPVHYGWMKNGEGIPEEDRPEYRIAAMDFEDEGTYYCHAGNVCGETVSEPITLFVAPQICMVTVDVETGDNLIVWEKKGAAPVSAYRVYRESIVAGEYEPIGKVLAHNLTIFLDTVADPTRQAYIYKITALDDDGHESDIALCKPHKTIHLLTTINQTTGSTQLDWDHYYGFTYGTFHIYRSLTESNFDTIHSMSSSTTEYTDPNPNNELFYYRISVQRLEDCVATGEGNKADSGPYSHSLSNIEDNRLQTTGIEKPVEIEGIYIYPNPFSVSTTIQYPNPWKEPYMLRIINLAGSTVYVKQVYEPEIKIKRKNLENGFYMIELRGGNIYRGSLIIE